ncbi:hypothetical protein [Lacticaseibacillus brantae]|uniref:Uncharacterized protein n=1 Tax=Lacticaseibacillus brantae DSM 23927 TaxID=1423727 RepID=A0A0R2B049_9LACO|nr:hypothetical protein [Lacticaseibacillus brantae]KRM72743.1 hypothetical protein FC34_GL000453 [Lacticaseibacillus brantae DSM 23927]
MTVIEMTDWLNQHTEIVTGLNDRIYRDEQVKNERRSITARKSESYLERVTQQRLKASMMQIYTQLTHQLHGQSLTEWLTDNHHLDQLTDAIFAAKVA